MYKISKSFSGLQPYYPGVISAIWSLSQKRPSTARKKQFQRMLPQQILEMMSGKATICQVCCWVNIRYLGKKMEKKLHFLLLTKLVKSYFFLSLLYIIYTLSGCFICFYFFTSYINSPFINVSFYKKNIFAIWQTQLLLASPVRPNTQHLSFGVAILIASWTVTLSVPLLSSSSNQGQSSPRQITEKWGSDDL